MESGDAGPGVRAVEAIDRMKGKGGSQALADYLLTAPIGLVATRAAMVLEKRKHKSTLPTLYQVYETRPEMSEDIIPIFSAMEDEDAVGLIAADLRLICAGPARMTALLYLVKCADPEGLVGLLLPLLVLDEIPGARDDLMWATKEILLAAEDDTLEEIGKMAKELGPEALSLVEPYLPAKGELELEAPRIAGAFIEHLVEIELLELVPGSEEALVETLAHAICEARSPKGLVKDVERILVDSPAVEEVFADRDDIRKAFSHVTS